MADNSNPYSTHILFFPFQWRLAGLSPKKSARARFREIEKSVQSSEHWKKVAHSRQRNTFDYSQINYLHEAALDAVFEGKQAFPSVYNFEYFSEQAFTLKVRSAKAPDALKKRTDLQCSDDASLLQFSLVFKFAQLNIYETGIGVLSLFLVNFQHGTKEEVLVINDMIRRLYPPHLNPKSGVERLKNGFMLPDSVQLGDFPIEDWSDYPKRLENAPPSDVKPTPLDLSTVPDHYIPKYLLALLGPAFFVDNQNLVLGNIGIQQLLDDRMFLMCLLVDPDAVTDLKKPDQAYLSDGFWYKFMFVDSDTPTIANPEMQKELVRNGSYPRWVEDGTLFGACRYAFVAATGKSGLVAPPFTGNYRRLVELCLVQRASALKFRGEASEIAAEIAAGTGDAGSSCPTNPNPVRRLYPICKSLSLSGSNACRARLGIIRPAAQTNAGAGASGRTERRIGRAPQLRHHVARGAAQQCPDFPDRAGSSAFAALVFPYLF